MQDEVCGGQRRVSALLICRQEPRRAPLGSHTPTRARPRDPVARADTRGEGPAPPSVPGGPSPTPAFKAVPGARSPWATAWTSCFKTAALLATVCSRQAASSV